MSVPFVSDRVWVPLRRLDMKDVRKTYTHSLFDESSCARCEFKADKVAHPTEEDVCYPCEAFGGTYRLFRHRETEAGKYVGLPIGDMDSIAEKYDISDIVERRSAPKFKHKIKFLGTLRDYQEPAVRAMVKAGSGVLEAPPRSGKTVMGTDLCIRIGKKTLIMAAQQDWLDQFYETFCGGDMMDAITNIPELEAKLGYQICGMAKKKEDFENLDIALTTYQMFMETYGKKRMRWIRRKFGTLIIDEAHGTGADQFAKVVNALQCEHRFGLTATPDRKDSKEFLLYSIIGPVRYRVEIENLVPRIIFKETGHKKRLSSWNGMLKGLATDEDRNALIVRTVCSAVRKGHNVVIPLYGLDHVNELVNLINEEYGKQIAFPFHGRLRKDVRKATLALAREAKKCRVIVGIRKLVQTGINVPKWSCLIEAMPISNTPKLKQETYRILTPLEGKNDPVIVHLLDDAPIPKACTRKTVADYKLFKFRISKKMWERVSPYIARSRKYEMDSPSDDAPVKTKYDKSRPAPKPKVTVRRMF